MSFAAVTKVAGITTGDDKSKSVLMWLAFHLNEKTGICCPSFSLLRKEMEVGSDNTIRAALTRLREKGLVSWTREIENGAVKRTLYTLHLDASVDEPASMTDAPSTADVPQRLKGGPSMVEQGSLNGCAGVPQPVNGNMEIEHGKEQGKEHGSFLRASPDDEKSHLDTNPNPAQFEGVPFPDFEEASDDELFAAELIKADKAQSEPAPESEAKPKAKTRKATAKKADVWPVEDDGVDAETREAYLALRKAKRSGPFTPKAYDLLKTQATKHGASVKVAIEKCIERGWVFPYEGAFEKEKNHGKTRQSQQKSAFLRPQSEIDYTYGLDRWNRA